MKPTVRLTGFLLRRSDLRMDPALRTLLALRWRGLRRRMFRGLKTRRGAVFTVVAALMLLGWIHARFDSPESQHMEGLLLESMSIFTDLGTRPHCALAHFYLGQAYAGLGRTEEAKEHLRTAADMFREMGMDYWLDLSQEAKEGL